MGMSDSQYWGGGSFRNELLMTAGLFFRFFQIPALEFHFQL